MRHNGTERSYRRESSPEDCSPYHVLKINFSASSPYLPSKVSDNSIAGVCSGSKPNSSNTVRTISNTYCRLIIALGRISRIPAGSRGGTFSPITQKPFDYNRIVDKLFKTC